MLHKLNDFYVGQRVKIRSIEDMEAEYGLRPSSPNLIYCPGVVFNKDGMSKFCGATATIEATIDEIGIDGPDGLIILNDWEDSNGSKNARLNDSAQSWGWTVCMVEPVEPEELKFSFDSEAFNKMLGVS